MSLKQLQWELFPSTEKDFFAQLLKNRNIASVEELNKPIFSLWPSKNDFPQIWQAVHLFYSFMNHHITIVGDYDVDGTSATAIMSDYFTKLNVDFTYYIPNRFTDGYGLSMNIIEKILKTNTKLVITLDNGTNSQTEIQLLQDNKIKCIVIDHHLIQNKANMDVLINPVELQKPYSKTCATALTFIFLCELNKFLVHKGFLKEKISMKQYLDIVALATICDVMPLTGINRNFVSLGVEKLKKNPNKLFEKLISLRKQIIDSRNIGFNIGPYLNAAGRIEEGSIAVEALRNYSDENTCKIISLNAKRKKIEKEVLGKAIEFNGDSNGICAIGKDWHEGVVGIVAGRLKEMFNKPTIVLTANQQTYKGSIRAVKGFHCGDFIQNCIVRNLVTCGGGHEMAGGITVLKDSIHNFEQFFHEYCNGGNFTIEKNSLKIDCVLSLSSVQQNTFDKINMLSPFGNANQEPIFLFPNCIIENCFCVEDHCFLTLKQWNKRVKSKIFFISRTKFTALKKIGTKLNVVASIVKGIEAIEIEIIDAEII